MTNREIRDRVLRNGVILSLPVSLALWLGNCWHGSEMPSYTRDETNASVEQRTAASAPARENADVRDHERQAVKRDLDYRAIYETLKRHEGVRRIAYNDTEGIRTIGVGFNLERQDARERISALGLDYNLVYAGQQALNERQMEQLMEVDVEQAIKDARNYVGERAWSELDSNAQEIIVNMSYNLGITKLSKFVKLQEALINRDYERASYEMEDSKWYSQVGNRSKELVERMREIGKGEKR